MTNVNSQSSNQPNNPYLKKSHQPTLHHDSLNHSIGQSNNQSINHENNPYLKKFNQSTNRNPTMNSTAMQISENVNSPTRIRSNQPSAAPIEDHVSQSINSSIDQPDDETMSMTRYAVFCAPKAGMQSVDTSVVNQTVFELSKNSAHFAQALNKDKQVSVKIKSMLNQANNLSITQSNALRTKANSIIQSLESDRQLDKVWCHIDLDSFYASVELLDRPDLIDKPLAVGGQSMIATSNYVARNFGVRAAMPGFIATKLCPNLIFIKPDFSKYKACAEIFRKVFAIYDPLFESYSLDEAYLDITEVVQKRVAERLNNQSNESSSDQSINQPNSDLNNPADIQASKPPIDQESDQSMNQLDQLANQSTNQSDQSINQSINLCDYPELREQISAEVASEIRHLVHQDTRLTCSAGIAPNRMLAKMCTDVNKPNGQFILKASTNQIFAFLEGQKVRKIPGVGKVMERMLNELGIQSIDQIRSEQFTPLLLTCFSEITSLWLLRASLGIGRVEHETEEDLKRKSISTERTFNKISSVVALEAKLDEIAHMLAEDIIKLNNRSTNPLSHQSTNTLDTQSDDQHEKHLDNQSTDQPNEQSINQSISQSNKGKLRGRTLTLKMKTTAFEIKQRSITQPTWISTYEQIHRLGLTLLREELAALSAQSNNQSNLSASKSMDGLLELRLMGLRLSSLDQSSNQPSNHSAGSIRQFAYSISDEDIDDEIEIIDRSDNQPSNEPVDSTKLSVHQSKHQPSSSINQSNNLLSSKRSQSSRNHISTFFDVENNDDSDSDLCLIDESNSLIINQSSNRSISHSSKQSSSPVALHSNSHNNKSIKPTKSNIKNFLQPQPASQSVVLPADESIDVIDDDCEIDEFFGINSATVRQPTTRPNQSINRADKKRSNNQTNASHKPFKRARVTLDGFLKPQQPTTIDLID